MEILKHAHSGLRWVVLVVLLVAIVNNLTKMNSGKSYTKGDFKINLFTLIFSHIQFTIGMVLYFMSPLVTYKMGEKKR